MHCIMRIVRLRVRRFLRGLACLLCCTGAWAQPAETLPALQGLTEALPPLNFEQDGKVVGFSSEVLDLIGKESGLTINKTLLPWARAYQEAQQGPNKILYSLVRTPEREALFHWIGPISKRRIYLYRHATRADIKLKSLNDATAYMIGTARGSAAMSFLLARGFEEGVQLDPALDDARNMRKFKAQRFDLLLSLDWAATYNARQQGMESHELVPALLVDDSSEYWFGVSLGTDPRVLYRLESAMARIRKDGRLQALVRRYLPDAP